MLLKYKCKCMRVEREIVVTDRVKGSEIGDWMANVVEPSTSYDHRSRNPLCVVGKTEYIKIPMNEDTGEVGVPETRQ